MTLQQATTDQHLHWKLLDTHRQVWVGLLWGHWSFLLGPGAHKVCVCVCVCACARAPRVCFPVPRKFCGSMVGLMVTSSKRAYAIPRSAAPRAPAHCWLVPPEDTEAQFWLSFCGVSGSWCTQGLFEPSKHHWQVWAMILNSISPLLPSCWGFSFACGNGYLFLVGSSILLLMVIQHQVVMLEFSQEEMSSCPSGKPSCKPEIKLQTFSGSLKKQQSSWKTPTSALLTLPKSLTVWITKNCGKFFKRWE